MFSKLAAASFLLSLPYALAITEVTAKPLPWACASFPGYNGDNTAGPWVLQLVDSDNKAIDGFSNTHVYAVGFTTQPFLRWGRITIPTNNQIAKTPLQCNNGTLMARVPNDLTAAGAPTNSQWTALTLSGIPYDDELMWKVTGGSQVKIFEHYIGDEKQPGVFIGGYDDSTKWGFKYYEADMGSYNLPYYQMRLLGPNSKDPVTGNALLANETMGYLKIYA